MKYLGSLALGLAFALISLSGSVLVPAPTFAATCGAYVYEESDFSDLTCPITTSLYNLNIYKTMPKCPTNPEGKACTGPCKINTLTQMSGCVVQTDVYRCDASVTPSDPQNCPVTVQPVTTSLVANPNAIVRGEQSLLTWSSANATECTGTNFSTSGAMSGSVLVAPAVTTQYSVTCSGAGGNASAQASVAVTDPSDPEPPFSVSCRAHPTSAGIGEDVLWSSTVTGGQGTYTYEWSGTDGLTGTANQVFKKYSSIGQKTASLTVTYTPSQPAAPAASQAPPEPAPSSTTPPPTSPTPPVLGGEQVPPAAICPQIGWMTPITPCTGIWAPTYDMGGCQNGWQCMPFAGGGGYVPPSEDTSIIDSILNFFQYDTSIDTSVPEIQTIEGSVLGAGAQTIAVQCENEVIIRAPQCSDDVDNDGSGEVDYPDDPNCDSGDDDDESDDRPPQCSDNIDNDSDGKQDHPDDPECSGPGDDDEDSDGPPPQCSDGIDNDGDGEVDDEDDGCYSGGGGGGYDPNDNSEAGGGGGATQCSDGIDNNGDGNIDFPDDPGCSSAADDSEVAPESELTLTANPPLIKKNQQCTLTLSARNVTSCTLNGPGISRGFTAQGGIVSGATVVTPGLTQTSTYTLTCNGLDGKRVSKTVDCKIAPTFEEF